MAKVKEVGRLPAPINARDLREILRGFEFAYGEAEVSIHEDSSQMMWLSVRVLDHE